jgi:hypothetical protein
MRRFGFSTGALALGDFRSGLEMTKRRSLPVVELSALREDELPRLLDTWKSLDLRAFTYVSIHAPSAMDPENESRIRGRIRDEAPHECPIIVHPDAIHTVAGWRELGSRICIENMDKRKPIGRTVKELRDVFRELPEAGFCFDIGHARQVDPTMTEAAQMLKAFKSRLRQVHVSEVNTRSRHDRLSFVSILAFQEVAHLIPDEIPLVLETPVTESEMDDELSVVAKALPSVVLAG